MAAPQNFVSVSRRPPDVEDYIDMLRRYRSWLIGPMFVGLVAAVVVAFMWPDTFESSAVMRITPQQISERLVPTVVNMQMQQRLQQMQQQILSRGSLSELIQRPALDLYRKERAKLPLEDVINDMKNPNKGIRIQMVDVQAAGQPRVTSAFTISFKYPDRFKAQAVVRELVSKFMEENNAVLRQQADTASGFIGETLKAAKEKMDALDQQISQFRAQNLGRLPEQFQANVAQLQSLQMQLGNTNESLSRLQQQKMQIETQLQNANTQLNYYKSVMEEQVMTGGAQTVRNNRLDALNQRMLDLQSSLAAAKELYTPSHPQIKKIEASLKALEGEYDKAQKEDLERQAAAATANAPQIQRRVNPTAVKMVQDIEAQIANYKTDIQTTNLSMEEKIKQVQQINAAITGYNTRIESSPQLEQQYAALMRDYAMAKQSYEENHKKQEFTDTAKSIEEHKAGENLEVLDPPSDPIAPTEPNRLQIAAMGTGVGLMLGVVLAGAKEMKNTSLKNLKDVRAYTNLPVLSSIPLLENALLIRRKRRLLWLAWSSAIIIGSIAMSASAYYYYVGGRT